MLRHHAALPALIGLRTVRFLGGRRGLSGFRMLLLHDIPRRSFRAFEQLVDYVARTHGILLPDEAAAWVDQGRQKHRPHKADGGDMAGRLPCLLTFDDGFVSNHEVAVEILDRKGIKALFFVCPGLMDLSGLAQRTAVAANIFDGRVTAEGMAPELRLMTWDDLKDLRDRGHAIGAHGMMHHRLSQLSGDPLRQEIVPSGEVLKERLGVDVPWYAYAFGNAESVSAEALHLIAANFKYCRSGVRGINTDETDPHLLLSDQVDVDSPGAYQRLVLEGGLDGRYGAARKKLAAMHAKAI